MRSVNWEAAALGAVTIIAYAVITIGLCSGWFN